MRPGKVVLIGAASASFGPNMIADAVLTPGMAGSSLVLVDSDAERLEVMHSYANKLNQVTGAGLIISATTDRLRALPEADFVISSFAIRRNELWKLDFHIPDKYGIKQVLGENGGPGGLSHALRNIPVLLAIARDMEKVCPNAWLLNFSNPESRLCLAISRYTGLKFAGLCHGIGDGYHSISRLTGVPPNDIMGIAAGLNHFAWFQSIQRRSTGEDLYPLLRQSEPDYDPSYEPLTRRLFHMYGQYPHPSDNHIGEYLGYAWEFCGTKGYDFEGAEMVRAERWRRVLAVSQGEMQVALPDHPSHPADTPVMILRSSGEFAWQIIAAVLADQPRLIEAVNIRNNGSITGLPDWAVVEVPAYASANGLNGLQIGALPAGINALLSNQVQIQSLVVDAAVLGRRDLALQALLVDPVVTSYDNAQKPIDELLRVHAAYLPQFR
ncbi:MAG: family 4 glycosyl hydrolase [Anaerolineae bacterium]